MENQEMKIGFHTCMFCKYSNSATSKKEDNKLMIWCNRKKDYVNSRNVCNDWRYVL